jgi:hypothetical protein
MTNFKEMLRKGLITFAAINLALFYSFVGLASSAQAIAADSEIPAIDDIVISKKIVKEGDSLTVTANVADRDGVAAVSADFSYHPDYNDINRPVPRSVTMELTSGNQYRVDYIVPASWNEGNMYITVAAKDNLGNRNPNRDAAQIVVVDNTGPVLNWLNPQIGDLIAGTTNLSVSAIDSLSQSEQVEFWWKKDSSSAYFPSNSELVTRGDAGNTGDTYNYNLDTTTLVDDEYDLKITSKDSVGNESKLEIDVIVDNTIPTNVEIKKAQAYDHDLLMENRKERLLLEGDAQDANGISNYKWDFLGSNIFNDKEGVSNKFYTETPGTYTLKLAVKDMAGNKATKTIDVVVENQLPDSPSLSMTRDDGIIKLKWNKTTDTRGYQIVKNGIPLQSRDNLLTKNTTRYIDYDVENGKSYEYRVRAFDADQQYLQDNNIAIEETFSRSNATYVYVPEPEVRIVASAVGGRVVANDAFSIDQGEVKAQEDGEEDEREEGQIKDEQKNGVEETSEQARTNWPMIIAIIIAATIVLGGAAYWWYGISEDEDQI